MKITQAVCLVILGFGIGWYAHRPIHELRVIRGTLMIDSANGKSCWAQLPSGQWLDGLPNCQDEVKQH
jgi:hypothetical protein